MVDSGEKQAGEDRGKAISESRGGELSEESKQIQKLIQICQEFRVVKVVRNGKQKNIQWQVEVTNAEYAFVSFESEECASKARAKLILDDLIKEKKMTVFISEDEKSLFIGNVRKEYMKKAVEEATHQILKVRLLMANRLSELRDELSELLGEAESSAATNGIGKLIAQHLSNKDVGVVKVVRKPKNFQWEITQVLNVEYAFVNFQDEASALKASEKLNADDHVMEREITVSFIEDEKTLFIGNVQLNKLDMAAEEATAEILEVGRAMGMELKGLESMMRYTVRGIDEYRVFIKDLREKLAKRQKKNGPKEEITVGEKLSAALLPKKSELDKQGQLLLHIELKAKEDKKQASWTTTLVMRKDNLYIVGFTGKGGKWFEIDYGKDEWRLPGEYKSELLPFDVRYKSVMNLKVQDQVKRTLSNTTLGQDFVIRAVRRLLQYPNHSYNYNDDENPTRLGLAGLMVLISESARFKSICNVFRNNDDWAWGVVITSDVLDHIWEWGTESTALRRWKKHGEYVGGSNLADVLGRLGLVLNSEKDSVEGGARVEIFSVYANFKVTSIIVKDSNGNNQIICRHEGIGDLDLNVVPKGISGYKWFDLDIKSAKPETWRFDCRKQRGTATAVVKQEMEFDSERKMDVTYLVMSDTVKAMVEVKLRHPYSRPTPRMEGERKCTVHGEIAACIDGYSHRIVLFRIHDRSKAKAVEGGPTLKLERSDVWVPHKKRVHIEMDLLVNLGDGEDIPYRRCLSFGFGEMSPSSGDNDSAVKVNIAWDGIPEKIVKPDDNDKVEWTVSDGAQAFTNCIMELRKKVATPTRNDERVLKDYEFKDGLNDPC